MSHFRLLQIVDSVEVDQSIDKTPKKFVWTPKLKVLHCFAHKFTHSCTVCFQRTSRSVYWTLDSAPVFWNTPVKNTRSTWRQNRSTFRRLLSENWLSISFTVGGSSLNNLSLSRTRTLGLMSEQFFDTVSPLRLDNRSSFQFDVLLRLHHQRSNNYHIAKPCTAYQLTEQL